jgi:hypothetical protein
MPAGSFIRYLPSGAIGAAPVPVTVVEADVTDAELWDRDIQQPWIAKTNRIDASWRWRTNYLRAALVERSLGRELAYLQLQTAAADGDVFPIGQILLASGYPYPPDRGLPCVFLWFLAGSPPEAARAAGVPAYKGVLAALVDTALQFSYLEGFDGRLCLHASPAGTADQRAELMERYRKAGLLPFAGRWFAGWWRRNDGRYFYADPALAAMLTARLDAFR